MTHLPQGDQDDQELPRQTTGTLDGSIVIPMMEERLDIQTRERATGVVSLQKRVEEYRETLDIPLASRTFDIERVLLNRPVETAPGVRQEGDTTIYSLVEEQLVITRQLILREEVRVTRRDTEHRDTRTVTLQREHLDITRTPLTDREPTEDAPR